MGEADQLSEEVGVLGFFFFLFCQSLEALVFRRVGSVQFNVLLSRVYTERGRRFFGCRLRGFGTRRVH